MTERAASPVRRRFSLRLRFIAAMMAIVAILGVGFYIAVRVGLETMEHVAIGERLEDEFEEHLELVRAHPDNPLPEHPDFRGFLVRPGSSEEAALPTKVRRLKPGGKRHEIVVDGRSYYAGAEDVDGHRLFLMIDVERIEDLEAQLTRLAWIFIPSAMALAIGVALGLSRLVIKPVSRLATEVAHLEPGKPHASLASDVGDREIDTIARALDHYVERVNAFVHREQAFTEDASHELRTPLAVILSALPLLQLDVGESPRALERLARVERAARRMHETIEALLFLAREGGTMPMVDCSLDQIAQDAVTELRPQIGAKAVALEVDAEPTRVHGPPALIASVVHNLVLNALHHTERGWVRVSLRERVLTVADTGRGIPPEDLDRIFERRFRGTASAGFGLGLYLVRRITERLGWTIGVESTSSGSRFHLQIPAHDAARPESTQS
jgi:signal transduction histidine kinase